jgi:protein TonB
VPEYPKSLRKTGVKGEAVVAMRITRQGVVVEPTIERATDPAFAEATLAAVRQWRFLPQVKGGRPVETAVSLPITFDPPESDDKL